MAADKRLAWILALLRSAVVYGLILLVAGFAGNLWLSRDQASGFAPLINGPDLQGNWLRIQPGGASQPRLLYFFADWCPICGMQHSAIESITASYPVLGIAMQSGDTENVRQYVRQSGLSFPVINDVHGEISHSYGVDGVPATFVVDRAGVIRFSTRGYATRFGLWLRLWWSGLE